VIIYYTIPMTLNEVLYVLLIFIELTFLIAASVYMILLNYSWLKGAPYVATKKKSLKEIINNAKITDGNHIIELGSGDGRFLRTVAKQYQITGLGVDVNPLPIFKARIIARLQNLTTVEFKIQDIRDTDLSEADVIYMYLIPKFIQKIKNQLLHKTKKGAIIVSHGFKIDYLEQYLVNTITDETFKTYFYKRS